MPVKYWELITGVIGHLAWPVTVIIVVLMFRKGILVLLGRLRKIASGEHSAEFSETRSDREESARIQDALAKNDVALINRVLGPPALRLLLALSGRQEKLPLTLYRARQYASAKKRILQLGLATYTDNRFSITELGLKVVRKQLDQREIAVSASGQRPVQGAS